MKEENNKLKDQLDEIYEKAQEISIFIEFAKMTEYDRLVILTKIKEIYGLTEY